MQNQYGRLTQDDLSQLLKGHSEPQASRIWGTSSKSCGVRRGRIRPASCTICGKKPLLLNTAALGPENAHMTSTQCPTWISSSLLETARRGNNISMICTLWPFLLPHYSYFTYKNKEQWTQYLHSKIEWGEHVCFISKKKKAFSGTMDYTLWKAYSAWTAWAASVGKMALAIVWEDFKLHSRELRTVIVSFHLQTKIFYSLG